VRRRERLLLALGLPLAVAACGGGSSSPAQVVREWSDALAADDNERAASLFARDAVVIQGSTARTFHTRAEAVAWNSHLPCSGKVASLETRGSTATAAFRLANRKRGRCNAPPGAQATAVFVVEDGKIILWVQTGSQIAVH
jgi:limonene-1,2-epoxide hydrolase